MSLGTFLQAVISIVFIYLILALLTSELQEYLATITESRAKRLKQSIRQMLGEGSLESVGNDKNKFKVFSPSYQQDNVVVPATWEQQYSLQDERAICSNQGLQKYLGTDVIRASAENACKAWIEGQVITPVANLDHVFAEGNKEYIWIGKIQDQNQEYLAAEVINDPQNPEQGFFKNASRLEVVSNEHNLGAESLVWLDENNSLNPVIYLRNIQQEADGSSIIWIDHQTRQEVHPDLANPEMASKYHVYVSPVDLPPESKLWIQGQVIGLIEELDYRYIQNQAFVWVNTASQILDPGSIITDPESSNVASDKQICVKRYSVFQLVMPLSRDTRYYVDHHHNQIRAPLEVYSLTEKIYQHPKIVALNQSAVSWVSSFAFLSFPLQLSQWGPVHFCNLISIFLLILLAVSLWLQKGMWWYILIIVPLVLLRLICLWLISSIPRSSGITRTSQGPSYIDDSNLFVDVLIDVLRKESDTHFSLTNKGEVAKSVETLPFYTPAQSVLLERIKMSSIENLDAFKEDLNKLYEEVQKRSSGVYKRNAKGLSILVGLLIASVANADTFNMLTHLTKSDNEFSQGLIRQFAADPSLFQCEPGKDCFDQAKQAKLKALINDQGALPLGWSFNELFDLKKQKAELENQLDTIIALRNAQETKIKDIEKLVEYLKKFQCTSEGGQKCFNEYAERYYADQDVRSSLIDIELLALIRSSNKKGADFKKEYQALLDQKSQKILQLKQNFLQEDAARQDQEQQITQHLNRIKKQVKIIEESRATDTPIPKNSQDVITRLSQVSASSKSDQPSKRDHSSNSDNSSDQYSDHQKPSGAWDKIEYNVSRQGGWPKVLFGWLITAVALSMGAPFWFDLLSRVMNVRNAAKIPDSASPKTGSSQASNSSSQGSDSHTQAAN
jgi:hypothetical protein